MDQLDLKKEYFFKGNNIGCLVIHGFTGTPAELRQLGERLNGQGYTVMGVRLKGHGTTIEDMEQCSYKDWALSVEEGYRKLKATCDTIYVIGHSMGSLLSLYIGENYEVNKIVALSPPFINKDKRAEFAFIIKYFMKYSPWKDVKRNEEEMKYLIGYSKIPVKSVHEFNMLRDVVKKDLCKISKPLLIVHSKLDDVADYRSVSLIEKIVPTSLRKTVYLTKCKHNITVECEKETVFEEVINFLK